MVSVIQYVKLFKSLSDETRVRIIDMLSSGPLCACEILEAFSISQPTLSYHMKILVDSGLVIGVRDGSWMRYNLDADMASALMDFLAEVTREKHERLSSCCEPENIITID